MNTVLIISYFFNEMEIIGSRRARGLAKFLRKYGWRPIILTTESIDTLNFSEDIIKTKYDDISVILRRRMGFKEDLNVIEQLSNRKTGIISSIMEKTARWGIDFITYPDYYKGWRRYAVEAGQSVMKETKIDAIISTSSPITSHLIAYDLKKKSGVPWIADFRDLWIENPLYNHNPIRHLLENRLEKKIISDADAIVSVSEPLTKILEISFGGKPVFPILNGYDPENVNPGIELTNKLTVRFTGRLYQNKQNPEPLFQSIRELIDSNEINPNDFSVEFYGNQNFYLNEIIKKYHLESVIHILNEVSWEKITKIQRESQLLIQFTWEDPQEPGQYSGKIFDYLAAKRPILSIGKFGGVIKNLIESTNTGIHLTKKEDIKKVILRYYEEFKTNGQVQYHGKEELINRYSQDEMAKEFAKVLDSLL